MSDTFSRRRALTWIICAFVVVLGLPAGAFAVVAGSNAFITDAGTGHRAHVNSSGQLQVNAGGSAVKVAGIARTSSFPAKPYTMFCTASNASTNVDCVKTVPVGETFVVQSMTLECSNNVANVAVVPEVEDWNSAYTTETSLYVLPTSASQLDYSGYYDTASPLVGTEYLSGNVIFTCNASRTAISGYTMSVAATAQGYLSP